MEDLFVVNHDRETSTADPQDTAGLRPASHTDLELLFSPELVDGTWDPYASLTETMPDADLAAASAWFCSKEEHFNFMSAGAGEAHALGKISMPPTGGFTRDELLQQLYDEIMDHEPGSLTPEELADYLKKLNQFGNMNSNLIKELSDFLKTAQRAQTL